MSLPRLVVLLLVVVSLSTRKISCTGNGSSATPLSFPPSLYWDGIDGSWSTFTLQIGTPPQPARLLPSITGNTIWAVLSKACRNSSVSTCRSDRGDVFTTNQSSTWEDKGTFQLPLNPEHYLPFSDTAQFGFDNVTLNWPGYNGMILGHQVVAGYTTDDFYLGALGLSPLSVNLTSFNDQYPSFLSTLKEKNHIPSNSYGYTAGACYRPFPVTAFGSLTFGGYDATRMDASNNLTIVGGWDTYRPFLLSIDRITSGSTELLDAPIVTALDSIVSQIWLPISACQHFESVFGLIWNSTYELYLVNETHHSVLLAQNASIKFTLSTGSKQERNNERLDIILPYAAFDLTVKPPYAGLKEVMHYFPLKRAANDTQYTLGRTILQEVYMISDYDRAALSLFPARFPDSSIGSNLIPIQLPGEIPDVTTTEVHSQSVLSRTAIVSLAVGAGIILILLAVVVGIFFRRKRGEKLAIGTSSTEGSVELGGNPLYQASDVGGHVAGDVKHELASSGNPRGWTGPQTSPAISPPPQEMPGDLNKSLVWAKHYFPTEFLEGYVVGEDERTLELPSHPAPRAERCL